MTSKHGEWKRSGTGGRYLAVLLAVMSGFTAFAPAEAGPLNFSTYLGGKNQDFIRDIEIDRQGNIYIAGYTQSPDFSTTPGAYSADFPVTSGAFQKDQRTLDAFVVKLSADFSRLLYSTYMGGSGEDIFRCATVDRNWNLYAAGQSTSNNWPTLKPLQTSRVGNWDGVLAKFALPK